MWKLAYVVYEYKRENKYHELSASLGDFLFRYLDSLPFCFYCSVEQAWLKFNVERLFLARFITSHTFYALLNLGYCSENLKYFDLRSCSGKSIM